MLTRFDDYPIHQTPEPVAHPSTGDRNFYDRYFFNGYTRAGDLFFAAALGLYPNRRVMDAAFSVVRDGRQHVVRASRVAPDERGEIRVGPIAVEVLEPLRALRVLVAPNAFGLEADLVFTARTVPIEEPRFTYRRETRVLMDSTRLTQFGTWEGSLAVGGASIPIRRADVLGCRDRSWGIRMVGEPEGGAPGGLPQFFWLWAPIHFDDVCTHFDVNEDAEGRPWHAAGCVVPVGERGTVEPMARVAHRVTWRRGMRRAEKAEITLTPHREPPLAITLEPILTFQMVGLGYLHPTWGHGMWQGPEAVDGETWTLADLDPMDPRHLHVQQLCRARAGGREGLGVLEQLVIGPHAPSGFRSLLDPAS
jgi:hypothetical protein